jgi:hypothetical protein
VGELMLTKFADGRFKGRLKEQNAAYSVDRRYLFPGMMASLLSLAAIDSAKNGHPLAMVPTIGGLLGTIATAAAANEHYDKTRMSERDKATNVKTATLLGAVGGAGAGLAGAAIFNPKQRNAIKRVLERVGKFKTYDMVLPVVAGITAAGIGGAAADRLHKNIGTKGSAAKTGPVVAGLLTGGLVGTTAHELMHKRLRAGGFGLGLSAATLGGLAYMDYLSRKVNKNTAGRRALKAGASLGLAAEEARRHGGL